MDTVIFSAVYAAFGAFTGWLAYRGFKVNAEWPWWKAGPAIAGCAILWPVAAITGLWILFTQDWSK